MNVNSLNLLRIHFNSYVIGFRSAQIYRPNLFHLFIPREIDRASSRRKKIDMMMTFVSSANATIRTWLGYYLARCWMQHKASLCNENIEFYAPMVTIFFFKKSKQSFCWWLVIAYALVDPVGNEVWHMFSMLDWFPLGITVEPFLMIDAITQKSFGTRQLD